MKKGFTLLELIVVIIIIGILGALGFIQYTRVVEKSRTGEAKDVLGQMRTAEEAYNVQYGARTATIGALSVEVPTACDSNHYFIYTTTATVGTATRCTSGGKDPQGTVAYTVTVDYSAGTWGGSAGYY